MKILFVCTGNTCRSPMAVAAWRSLPLELMSLAEVSSAGLMAHAGMRATGNAIEVSYRWGVDLSEHRARRADENLMAESDLICAMTTDAVDTLREAYPQQAARVRSLSEFSHYASDDGVASGEIKKFAELLGVEPHELESADIADPYGGSLEEYASAAAQIRRAVEGLAIAIAGGEVASL